MIEQVTPKGDYVETVFAVASVVTGVHCGMLDMWFSFFDCDLRADHIDRLAASCEGYWTRCREV